MYERTESIESYCLGNQIALCSALPNALAISLNCISSGIFRPQVFLNSLSPCSHPISLLSRAAFPSISTISLSTVHFEKAGPRFLAKQPFAASWPEVAGTNLHHRPPARYELTFSSVETAHPQKQHPAQDARHPYGRSVNHVV